MHGIREAMPIRADKVRRHLSAQPLDAVLSCARSPGAVTLSCLAVQRLTAPISGSALIWKTHFNLSSKGLEQISRVMAGDLAAWPH